MIKYRGTYRVFMPIDYSTGYSTENEDDTYIKCPQSKARIYRWNEDTLAVEFTSIRMANNRSKELEKKGVKLILRQEGDFERIYLFSESDIHKVAEILKPITKGKNKSPKVRAKRQISEAERDRLRKQMENIRTKRKIDIKGVD